MNEDGTFSTDRPGGVALKACQDAVVAHRKELGTPPQGVLDDDCDPATPGADCRVCCDHARNCNCSPKPPSLLELLSGDGYGDLASIAGGWHQAV
jgi:hypothetical protein